MERELSPEHEEVRRRAEEIIKARIARIACEQPEEE